LLPSHLPVARSYFISLTTLVGLIRHEGLRSFPPREEALLKPGILVRQANPVPAAPGMGGHVFGLQGAQEGELTGLVLAIQLSLTRIKIINSLSKGRPADAAALAAGSLPPPREPNGHQLLPASNESSLLEMHKAAFFFKLERELEKARFGLIVLSLTCSDRFETDQCVLSEQGSRAQGPVAHLDR
jgi:hypothetical protein